MPDQKTPPAVLITRSEKGVVRRAVRTLVKALVPHLPAIAKFGGPAAVGFILTTAHTWKEKIETRKQVEQKAAEVSKQATETTRRAYKGLAKPANKAIDELAALSARVASVEATNKAQSALIVELEKDFVVTGKPAAVRAAHRIDAGLVKAVKENAAKDSKELAARTKKPVPIIAPIPLELPAAPPGGAGGSAPPIARAPLPQPTDAGRSQ
jgi:hypothetical protein